MVHHLRRPQTPGQLGTQLHRSRLTVVKCCLQAIFDAVKARDPDQKEFLQAVEEVLQSLEPVLKKRPELVPIVQRLCEPERQILFRVPWCVSDLRDQVAPLGGQLKCKYDERTLG